MREKLLSTDEAISKSPKVGRELGGGGPPHVWAETRISTSWVGDGEGEGVLPLGPHNYTGC